MIVYFDTSALVKLLIDEPGTAAVQRLWEEAERRVACALTVVEARAALAAARRADRLTVSQAARAKTELLALIDDLALVVVGDRLIDDAGALAESEALRGYDAVHLAAALLSTAEVFASADRELADAAARHGLHVVDPLTGDRSGVD